jgi:hypothetical protein
MTNRKDGSATQTDAGIVESKNGRPAHNRGSRHRTWVNWALAILTAPAAVLVRLFALGAVMSLDQCTDHPCRHLGPNEFVFGVLYDGAVVVAILTIGLSFFTAKRRRGILVPLCGLGLLAVDVAVLAASVTQ